MIQSSLYIVAFILYTLYSLVRHHYIMGLIPKSSIFLYLLNGKLCRKRKVNIIQSFFLSPHISVLLFQSLESIMSHNVLLFLRSVYSLVN